MFTHKLVKYFFISLFILIIFSSIIQNRTKLFTFQALIEARNKIKKPSGNFLSNKHYCTKFESFFNDNYDLRDLLIRLKNQLDYSIFKESKQVVIGKDGILSDKTVAEEQLISINSFTTEQNKKIQDRILQLNKYLKKNGLTLILIPIPLKNTVYPEYLPNPRVRHFNNNGFLLLREFLNKHSEILYVDLYKEFKNSINFPYFRTDLHINFFGAGIIAKETINLIGKDSRKCESLWNEKIQLYTSEFCGGDSTAMALLFPLKENAIFVKREVSAKPLFDKITGNNSPVVIFKAHRENQKAILPRSFMLGNSFMLYLYESGMVEYFKELYCILDYDYFPQLNAGIIPEGTKYVIWEFWEGQLKLHLSTDSWWAFLDKPMKFKSPNDTFYPQ